MAGRKGPESWYTRTEPTDGMSSAQKEAIEALRLLRAAGRRETRPARAKTLAEAEAQNWLLEQPNVVSLAVLREQGLTGKSARGYCAGFIRKVNQGRDE